MGSNVKYETVPVISLRIILAVFLTLMVLLVVLLTCLLLLFPKSAYVPVAEPAVEANTSTTPVPNLHPFPAGDVIVLDGGKQYILDRNVTVSTITITNSASLTVVDDGRAILLRTKNILIQNQGALVIGSEQNPHTSYLEIILYGRSDDPVVSRVFGRKFIGVAPTGTIDIHGPWKLSWTFLVEDLPIQDADQIVTLADEATTWKPGDKVVVATSDYDMNHTEEFELMQCDACNPNQVKIKGPVKYRHLGRIDRAGVDLRAEVGLLTRNIKIHGEMEETCYGDNMCKYFDQDTFGGTTHVLHGVRLARFYGIELYNMGQQVLGRYPIHFHRLFEAYGNYAKQLSIHHCFSRCVTIHASLGIVVEDVVGYDTLGHCFFLEDGNEMDNVLIHNLGLVTRAGSLLPSERNERMCIEMATNTTVYMPNVPEECRSTSTFWIPHPMNVLINNSAAGSEEFGYFYMFHRVPTGPSQDMLPPFHGERSPLSEFSGNRAHANGRFGYYLDRGVKTDPPTAVDPREFLSLIELERYQPHENRNLSLPRVPAILENFTGYMNQIGILIRGGDVWINGARLSDNDVAVQMASSATLPYDQGSHQELVNSTVVGRSQYNPDWANREWPCVGIEIQDGPILIKNNLFYSFQSNGSRRSYAIGFFPNNIGQNSPANTIDYNDFSSVDTRLFFGEVGSYFGTYDLDGDLTQIVYNKTANTYAVRLDNPLFSNSSSCEIMEPFRSCHLSDCGQLFVNVSSKNVRFGISDDLTPTQQLVLSGVDQSYTLTPTMLQFQPVLIANHTYHVEWINGSAPANVTFSMHNFDRSSFVRLMLRYPRSTSILSASVRVLDQATDRITSTASVSASSSSAQLDQVAGEAGYFWDQAAGILNVKMQVTWPPPREPYNYCADDGCHSFRIVTSPS